MTKSLVLIIWFAQSEGNSANRTALNEDSQTTCRSDLFLYYILQKSSRDPWENFNHFWEWS